MSLFKAFLVMFLFAAYRFFKGYVVFVRKLEDHRFSKTVGRPIQGITSSKHLDDQQAYLRKEHDDLLAEWSKYDPSLFAYIRSFFPKPDPKNAPKLSKRSRRQTPFSIRGIYFNPTYSDGDSDDFISSARAAKRSITDSSCRFILDFLNGGMEKEVYIHDLYVESVRSALRDPEIGTVTIEFSQGHQSNLGIRLEFGCIFDVVNVTVVEHADADDIEGVVWAYASSVMSPKRLRDIAGDVFFA